MIVDHVDLFGFCETLHRQAAKPNSITVCR